MLHLLRLYVHRGSFADEGGTTAHLAGEQLRGLRLPFPPLEEQRALVELLDDERGWADQALPVTGLTNLVT